MEKMTEEEIKRMNDKTHEENQKAIKKTWFNLPKFDDMPTGPGNSITKEREEISEKDKERTFDELYEELSFRDEDQQKRDQNLKEYEIKMAELREKDLEERRSELKLEEKRKKIEDADNMRDAQRKMTWNALTGMLFYPFFIIIACSLGYENAAKLLSDMSGSYFVAVAGIVMAFFAKEGLIIWKENK